MKGWPITIWFESEEAATRAGIVIGRYMVSCRPMLDFGKRFMQGSFEDLIRDIVDVFGLPSRALEIGIKEKAIPRNRRGPHDR